VLDPVFFGLNTGNFEFGKFYKDYRTSGWEYNGEAGKEQPVPRSSNAVVAHGKKKGPAGKSEVITEEEEEIEAN
jgi:hypothetical protein